MANMDHTRKPTISYVGGDYNTVFGTPEKGSPSKRVPTDREENLGMIRDWLTELNDPGADKILEQIEGEINE